MTGVSAGGRPFSRTPSSLVLVLFVVLGSFEAAAYPKGYDYCSLGEEHTMCLHQGLSRRCGVGSKGGPLTDGEKQLILDTHNRLRAYVATGQEARGQPGPQPSATDMQYLEWDDELALVAQRWADQCVFEHDRLRSVPRFNVGQNLFQSEGGVPWDEAILSWYSEVDFFDSDLVDHFIPENVTGHYTQLVWGNSRYIGCGKRTYPQSAGNRFKRDARYARKIADNHAYNYNWDTYLAAERSGKQKSGKQQQPQQQQQQQQPYDSSRVRYENELRAYNRSLHEYYEKYKGYLKNDQSYKAQIDRYREYLEQALRLNRGEESDTFNSLVDKYQTYKSVDERLKYYERKLKRKMQDHKRDSHPVFSKGYSFTPDRPVVAGVEFEYYVCNYGPAGNYPGARMYTKGVNRCPYGGLCSDPLIKEYYLPLEIENDPVLSSLYATKK